MLEKIFHWLTGCVRFQVTGDAARFFNIAAKSGLGLWGFQKEGTDSAAWIRAGEYKKLRGGDSAGGEALGAVGSPIDH
uniref:sporulation protein YqfD n=1 Tax=Neglectibacter timonensis TaxID=1776382 RepID=UPI00248DE2F4